MKLLFERSTPGHVHTILPELDVDMPALPEGAARGQRPHLPELAEICGRSEEAHV